MSSLKTQSTEPPRLHASTGVVDKYLSLQPSMLKTSYLSERTGTSSLDTAVAGSTVAAAVLVVVELVLASSSERGATKLELDKRRMMAAVVLRKRQAVEQLRRYLASVGGEGIEEVAVEQVEKVGTVVVEVDTEAVDQQVWV